MRSTPFLALILLATPALAEPPAAERRLTPEQVRQVLDEAAAKREATEAAPARRPLDIHGEVGASIGTGGYRSAYGAVSVGLPGGGFAAISAGSASGRIRGYAPAYDPYAPPLIP